MIKISYCNEKKFVYHLGKNRTTVKVNILGNIKEMGKRQNLYLIFVLLLAVLVFQSEKCNGQFHWGKNHRLEAQKLKTMLSQMRQSNIMMTTNTVIQYNSFLYYNFDHKQCIFTMII